MFQMTEEIQEKVNKANGQRKTRIVTDSDLKIFFQVLNENADNENIHTIRRYSGEGFVPNSYKWRAQISYIEAYRDPSTKSWIISALSTDAKRSNGRGALTTINGRAAE